MLVSGQIRELLIPAEQAELLGVQRPQPPVVRLAFQVQAVVAAIRALNFHTLFYILPKQTKGFRFRRLMVRSTNVTSGYR